MNEKWFNLGIDRIEKKLKTNAAAGLSLKAARSRGNRGAGHLFFIPRRSAVRIILDVVADFSLVILLLGAAFSLFFGMEETVKGLSVLIVTALNLATCGLIYYKSERSVESLSSLFYPTVKVVRNGRLYRIDFRHLVVGDVILFESGDILCCDARLVSSDGLRVRMRTDAENCVWLDKNAGWAVDPNELKAENMHNMVHAGSIVESGSGRAIVTALGKYTYLGAMTGGIPLPASAKRPAMLERMKKQFSKINITMLILVIPFSVISLLLGKMIPEREALLSVTFLTGVAVAATTTSQLLCTVFKLFYTNRIRALAASENPAVIRNAEVLDRISNADYLFLLDGCVATDGISHFNVATCAEGEIRNYKAMNKTAVSFAEYAYVYHKAANRSLSAGSRDHGEYLSGIAEFVDNSKIDKEAINIRCSVVSYSSGDLFYGFESVTFTDQGVEYTLKVSANREMLNNCNEIMLNGTRQSFSFDGKKNFQRVLNNYSSDGQIPLIFVLSSKSRGYSDSCFVGMVVLKEGIDEAFKSNVKRLERMGGKVISFVNDNTFPKFPIHMIDSEFVAKESFLSSERPLTYGFGRISGYKNFSDKDIVGLINFAHSKNKKVVVLGFSEEAAQIAKKADGFITCTDIPRNYEGDSDRELEFHISTGQNGSLMCAQTVKESADCLIIRPNGKRGGLVSVIGMFYDAIMLKRNISGYLRYMISGGFITALTVALPMLLGDGVLDSRHIVYAAFVFSLFVFFAFMQRGGSSMPTKDYGDVKSVKDYFVGDGAMLIASIVSSIVANLLPWAVNFFDVRYSLYKTGYMFTVYLLLFAVAAVLIFYDGCPFDLRRILKNYFLLIGIGVSLIVWLSCFAFSGIGVLFGISGWLPIQYMAITVVPAVVYALIFILLSHKKRSRKSE